MNRVPEDDWNVRILSKSDHVTSSAGLTIPTHGPLSEANRADAVVFASGKGVDKAIADADFIGAFDLDDGRQLIGSMCAGALILTELRLLDGRRATTYPTRMATLRQRGIEVVEEGFVRQGNLATAAGCLAAQDLAAWIIETLADRELADAVFASIKPVGEGCATFPGWA